MLLVSVQPPKPRSAAVAEVKAKALLAPSKKLAGQFADQILDLCGLCRVARRRAAVAGKRCTHV